MTRYNILNAYLLHSFFGNALSCILQGKGKKTKQDVVVNTAQTVILAIFLDLIRKLNFECWIIEQITCSFELTLFIIPLLKIINYVGESQVQNQETKHKSYTRSCRKRIMNNENKRPPKHNDDNMDDNQGEEQSPKR